MHALLIVARPFPIEYYPKPGQARGVQIDCDAQRIGLRYPVVAGLIGDAAASLRRLSSLLTRRRPQLSGPRANRNADMA